MSLNKNIHDKKYSDINHNENLVFFQTSAWLNKQENILNIPIHGWVYKPQNSYVRKHAFLKVLKSKYGLIPKEEEKKNVNERVNLLIADNERGREIIIKLDDAIYSLPKSSPNGHFETVLKIPVSVVNEKKCCSVSGNC